MLIRTARACQSSFTRRQFVYSICKLFGGRPRRASDERGEDSSQVSEDAPKKRPAARGRGGRGRGSGRGRGRGRAKAKPKPVPQLSSKPKETNKVKGKKLEEEKTPDEPPKKKSKAAAEDWTCKSLH